MEFPSFPFVDHSGILSPLQTAKALLPKVQTEKIPTFDLLLPLQHE